MVSSLRWEYIQLKTPLELWNALEGRFGNIQNTLLPELSVKWNDIRLLEYKSVPEFNLEMLRLRAMLQFCGKEISEADMIEKTLSTFPASAMILSNQYRLEFDKKRITTFNQLINLLHTAEKHNKVLLNNNVRPAGTKKVPETNYGKAAKGGRNPNNHVGILHHVEEGMEDVVEAMCGNEFRVLTLVFTAIGDKMHPAILQRRMAQIMSRELVLGMNHVTVVDSQIIGLKIVGQAASAADYKKYRESRDQEAYNIKEEEDGVDLNLTIVDFQVAKDQAQSMEVSDFD
ncbi:hypothetical protein ACLB2K_012793 [Fragaria x ananassa]